LLKTKQDKFKNYRVFAVNFSNNKHLTFDAQGYELKEVIDNIKEVTNVNSFILIGHSMGGLASRAYIQNEKKQDIKALITIDTPNLGGQSWGGIAAGSYTHKGGNAAVNLAGDSIALSKLNDISSNDNYYSNIDVYHLGYSDDLDSEKGYYITGDGIVEIWSQMGIDVLSPYRIIFSSDVESLKAYQTKDRDSIKCVDEVVKVNNLSNLIGSSHSDILQEKNAIKKILNIIDKYQNDLLPETDIVPQAPLLTTSIDGKTISLSWNNVSNVDKYILYYTPYPYTGKNTIKQVNMEMKTSDSAILKEGDSYYVGITSSNKIGESKCSNVELFTISD